MASQHPFLPIPKILHLDLYLKFHYLTFSSINFGYSNYLADSSDLILFQFDFMNGKQWSDLIIRMVLSFYGLLEWEGQVDLRNPGWISRLKKTSRKSLKEPIFQHFCWRPSQNQNKIHFTFRLFNMFKNSRWHSELLLKKKVPLFRTIKKFEYNFMRILESRFLRVLAKFIPRKVAFLIYNFYNTSDSCSDSLMTIHIIKRDSDHKNQLETSKEKNLIMHNKKKEIVLSRFQTFLNIRMKIIRKR